MRPDVISRGWSRRRREIVCGLALRANPSWPIRRTTAVLHGRTPDEPLHSTFGSRPDHFTRYRCGRARQPPPARAGRKPSLAAAASVPRNRARQVILERCVVVERLQPAPRSAAPGACRARRDGPAPNRRRGKRVRRHRRHEIDRGHVTTRREQQLFHIRGNLPTPSPDSSSSRRTACPSISNFAARDLPLHPSRRVLSTMRPEHTTTVADLASAFVIFRFLARGMLSGGCPASGAENTNASRARNRRSKVLEHRRHRITGQVVVLVGTLQARLRFGTSNASA